ncbi:glycoside hydrolase family 3 C-terminal domain-containing protein [Blautia schinkii]|nr:glycoside hydrolase family 3 C-terminal domain-containing protein [Blautia schinkii]
MRKTSTNHKTARRAGSLALCSAMIVSMASSPLAASDSKGMDAGTFYSDYSSLEETLEASLEVNQQIEEESIVLLKNEENTLPLADVKNISVFGKDSADFYYAGGGSGTAEGYYEDEEYIHFYDALEAAGFSVNPRLKSFYENDDISGSYSISDSEYVNETDVDTFTPAVKESYARYSDAAVVVIGRSGSEGGDQYAGKTAEGAEEKHGLELTDQEIKLVQHVTENFEKVVVVINSPAQMELGWIEDGAYGNIDAAIWVGHPGLNGCTAIGEVLNGTVNPSGKLADIYAADFTKDPTYLNMGDNLQIENGTTDYVYYDEEGNTQMLHSLEYEEGIYYGYRYYETRGFEEEQAGNAAWYDQNVVYPFGYGLSYTSFDWTVGDASKETDEDGHIYYSVPVTVTNTGSVAGKDVVELYYSAPYTAGQIEKSYVELGDFVKTDLLQPGSSQDVTLTIYEQDMASYDYNDANGNGHTGYELDGGEYSLKVMKNSHETAGECLVDIEATNYDTDRKTGKTVANRFSNGDSYDSFGGLLGDMTSMSRADFEGTFPTTPVSETIGPEETPVIEIDKELYDKINFQYTPGAGEEEQDQAWYDYYNSVDMAKWTQEAEVTVMADELPGLSSDDEKWTQFMNQMTIDEMIALANNGGYKTMAIERLGVPASEQADGPVAIKGSSGTKDSGIQWVSNINVAATWNTELAKLRGIMVGNEALQLGLNGWYAPGINIHRTPFGGRNFEYYAEDPLLVGKISAAVVNGCQSKGVIAFIKHYALNNQEEDRGAQLPGMESVAGSQFGLMTWATEQTVREIYLKAFQISVEDADARGLMTSMNQTGLHSNTNNFQLVMGVLRDEWGFQGYTVTDVVPAKTHNTYADTNTIARVGIDTILSAYQIAGTGEDEPGAAVWDATLTNKDGGAGSVTHDGKQNDITYAALRLSAQRTLFATVNSAVMKNGIDTSKFDEVADPEGNLGTSIGASVAMTGDDAGSTDVVYKVIKGKLPEGVTMKTTGELTGTPVESGSFNFTVQMTADGWIHAAKKFTITINDDLFESNVADGQAGAEYAGSINSTALTEEGTTIEYSLSDGALPEGLTVNGDGTITGIPATAGVFKFVVKANLVEEQDESTAASMFGSGDEEPSEYLLHYTITINNEDGSAPAENENA